MKLSEAYQMTAQHADTEKQGINAAVTSRVLATFFKVLNGLTAEQALSVISQGLKKNA